MASRSRSSESSVVDVLHTVFAEVAQLQLAPDAGPFRPLLDKLQQALLAIIQQISQHKAQQAAQMQSQVAGNAVNPMMGGPAGPPGMPPRPPMGAPGGPPSQGSPGIAMPNQDELRRMLQSQGQGG